MHCYLTGWPTYSGPFGDIAIYDVHALLTIQNYFQSPSISAINPISIAEEPPVLTPSKHYRDLALFSHLSCLVNKKISFGHSTVLTESGIFPEARVSYIMGV